MDAHTKVYSLLLDAISELLLVHWQHLKDWLYQLMLLMKLGTDILGSVQSKIMKTLDTKAAALRGNTIPVRAISKVSSFANEPRSGDVRFTGIMNELPVETQNIVNGVVQQHQAVIVHCGPTLRRAASAPRRTCTPGSARPPPRYTPTRRNIPTRSAETTRRARTLASARCQTEVLGRAASADSSEDANSTKESSPTPHHRADYLHPHSEYASGRDKLKPYDTDENGLIITRCGLRETEVLKELSALDVNTASPDKFERLLLATHEILNSADKENSDNASAIHNSQSTGWGSVQERAATEAVRVLVWLCRREETRPLWRDYFDLILLKLINAYGSPGKELLSDHQNSNVRKAAVFCLVYISKQRDEANKGGGGS
ncbi:unnamed protein product [Leptidea sinapis]|uniref:Uncharacterized protein n=1 Tax=Leptidea sinapis TaxID=189913 RepID=A0A5E4QUU4_9NEOP|nr:unnamed protein product [Leptidea sinapis]